MTVTAEKLKYYISCVDNNDVYTFIDWFESSYPNDVIPGGYEDKNPGMIVNEFNTWIDGYRKGLEDGRQKNQ